jgi:hypothetical protein
MFSFLFIVASTAEKVANKIREKGDGKKLSFSKLLVVSDTIQG